LAEEDLRLIESLARAATAGATFRVVWPRLLKALPARWRVRRLELVRVAGDQLEVLLAEEAVGHTTTIRSVRRGRAGSFANEVLSSRDALVVRAKPRPEDCDGQLTRTLLGFPMETARGTPACVVLHADATPAKIDVKPALWRAMARMFETAVVHIGVVERVAHLSQRAHHENIELRGELSAQRPVLIAESASMRRVVSLAEQVSEHEIAVLLLGESGTGKELVARHIHEHSPRKAGPFIAVNCGALPESLIESELFGHEKGAFTGASARRLGRFERAHRGTIFLDEVAELPLSAQVKLLRVLQERSFERVGGERSIPVDVRILAATHRPIQQMVERGQFRADLYYRLGAFPIDIPPLRQRPEDIAAIVHTRLAQLARKQRRAVPTLSTDTLAALCRASWPGNVRELENALERALILSPGDELPLSAFELQAAPLGDPQIETLEDATRRCIKSALRASHGKIYGPQGAAKLLGLKPSTLQTKMAKLRITK
jgi:formate hydrogenlyase transcriptional activator